MLESCKHSLYYTCPFLILSTDDGNLGSIRSLARRALHAKTGSHTVSILEADHKEDKLPLVSCSDNNLCEYKKSQELHSENDKLAKDIISMYRNGSPDYTTYLLKDISTMFLQETIHEQERKARCNIRKFTPQGLKRKPRHPIEYDYTRGTIIMHKPWNKIDTH